MHEISPSTPPTSPAHAPFDLGEFRIEPDRGVIVAASGEIAVQPKVLDVLLYLAQHHGQVVRKEALFEHIWPRGFVVDGVLKRCVFQLRKALGDDAKSPRFIETIPKRGYRLLMAPRALAPAADRATSPMQSARSPYRGLSRYELADAAYFTGRAAAVRQALVALDEQRKAGRGFLLLIGPSGCGKSSLARAGLLPALLARENTDARQVPFAILQLSEHGSDPFEALAAVLLQPGAMADLQGFECRQDALAAVLRDDPEELVRQLLALEGDSGPDQTASCLLVIDQFEELLVNPALDEEDRELFFATLYALARSGTMTMIATLRSDFYALFTRYPLLSQLRSPRGQIDVDFPGPSQVTEIVREPARLAGLSFDSHADGRTLDEHIIDDAINEADSLPLLSFLFEELYKHRTSDGVLRFATYESLGGLRGCLTRRAETVYQGLPASNRHALGRVFAQLIRADADNAGRVVATAASADSFADDPDALALVEAFVTARLFTSRVRGERSPARIKFAHEALFRFWPRAKDWVQSNYADLRFRRWLEQLATRWDGEARSRDFLLPAGKPLVEATRLMHSGQPLEDSTRAYIKASEKRSLRRDRLRTATVAGLAILALAAGVLAVVAGRQAQLAEEAQNEAQNAAMVARQSSEFLISVFDVADPTSTSETPTARDLVEKAVERVDGMREMAPEVRAQILTAMGAAARGFGAFDIARTSLTEALEAQRQAPNASANEIATILVKLANLLVEQDLLDDARARLEEARALVAGTGSAAESEMLNETGRLSFAEGKPAEALGAFTRRLELLQSQPYSDPLERASTLNNIAAANWALGDFSSAERFYLDAIALRREAAGEVDAELADYLGNLGVLLEGKGDLAESERRLQQAISMRRQVFGEDNHDNARTFAGLGMLQLNAKRYAEAADSLRLAQQVAGSRLGTSHTLSALTKVQYAEALIAAGQPDEALGMASGGREVFLDNHGPDHINTAYASAVVELARLCTGEVAAGQALADALDHFRGQLAPGSATPSRFEQRVEHARLRCGAARP